ncbi:hypothetical protein Pfo_020149, partial [Paulownia fortunei]
MTQLTAQRVADSDASLDSSSTWLRFLPALLMNKRASPHGEEVGCLNLVRKPPTPRHRQHHHHRRKSPISLLSGDSPPSMQPPPSLRLFQNNQKKTKLCTVELNPGNKGEDIEENLALTYLSLFPCLSYLSLQKLCRGDFIEVYSVIHAK